MSRLSRFKKGAVMKLPPLKVKRTVKPNSDSDDDDFQMKIPSLPKSKPTVAITGVSVQKPSTSAKGGGGTSNANTVESIYFNTDGNVAISKSSAESQDDGEKRSSKKNRPKKKMASEDDNEDEMVPDSSNQVPLGAAVVCAKTNQVVCPFCWKKLSDKLSGTTHVKSCGKNLPTERIFEALQLHEKQVKEWEGLGIAYPGFATSSNTKTGKPKPSKPRSRAKKNKDTELELAMALSVSLHEEIESRKLKEKEFLVESGLEKELESLESKDKNGRVVDLVSPPVSYRQRPEKKAKLPKMLPGQDNGIGKRRGKKDVNLTGTKLYTTTETERQNIINDRVGLILEQSNDTKHEEFYVRDKAHLPVDVPKRLKIYHKENSPLWKLSELDCESNTSGIFIIQDVAESKLRNENEIVQAGVAKTGHASSKVDVVSENQMEDVGNPFLMPEVFPLSKPVSSRNPVTKITKGDMIEFPKEPMIPSSYASGSLSLQNCSISSTLSSHQQDCSDFQLPRVVRDLMKMLSKRSFTDIILFGREEKPIRCHKLLLRARCPKILEDAVETRSSSTDKVHEIISLVGYSHVAVKAFVTFVYSGIIRRSLTSEELAELNVLANKYSMPLIPDEPPRKRVKTMDMEIQTEPLVTEINSSFTQTENLESINVSHKEDANDSLEDIFDISEALEKSKTSIVRKYSTNVKNISSNNKTFDDSGDKLFHNISGVNPCDGEAHNEIIEDIDDADNGNVSEDMFAGLEDEDDDAIFNEIAHNIEEGEIPSTYSWETSKAKKRTRSISQLSNSSVTSFTATQAALYWRKQLNKHKSLEAPHSEDDEKIDSRRDEVTTPFTEKCSKKYKVCSSESENENELLSNKKIDENEVIVIDDSDNETVYETDDNPKEKPEDVKDCKSKSIDNSINVNNMSLSWEDTYANVNVAPDVNTTSNFCEHASIVESPHHRNLTECETPKSSFSNDPCPENTFARLSVENVRNHSLGLNSPSYSPLKSVNYSKISCLDRSNPNPFGDHDDSVFAKIPEEMFNNPADDPCALISEREVSPSSSNICDKSNRKGRGKSKAQEGNKKPAAAAKEKALTKVRRNKNLHRAHSYSQEPQSSCRTPPTSSINTADGRTPMLNYSTIDTPILKNELKRFGLKPLPRPKAKVLLRHIYKETHK